VGYDTDVLRLPLWGSGGRDENQDPVNGHSLRTEPMKRDASPAISNGQVFLRGFQHLFCIGKPTQGSAA
jgi:hypothetical protein